MSLGSHQQCIGKSQVHFTPKWIIDTLGPFDLDPCAGNPRPWDCAKVNYGQNGLDLPWIGRIWLNPPFDRRYVGDWVLRLADHGTGTALLHARTETAWFEPIWNKASAILFLFNRIKFCRSDGNEYEANSGAPPVLISFGSRDQDILENCGIPGAFVTDWEIK